MAAQGFRGRTSAISQFRQPRSPRPSPPTRSRGFALDLARRYTNVCSYGDRLRHRRSFGVSCAPGSFRGASARARMLLPIRSRRRRRPRRWCGALEAIGAAVESERSGEAFFAVDGLRGIYGGDSAGVLAGGAGGGRAGAADRDRAESLRRLRRRLGAGRGAGARSACLPGAALGLDPALRLGGAAGARPRTLRRRPRAPRDQDAAGAARGSPPTRSPTASGRSACAARRLARGKDEPLRPRRPHEELAEQIELPEGTAGQPARARPGAADRPPAGGSPAPRQDPARPAPRGAAQRRRQLERRAGAGQADRLGPDAALAAGAAAGGAAGAGGGAAAAGARPRPAGRATRSSSRSAARSRAAAGSGRRCARSAPRRAPRRC